ncbi:MAG: hypothetical protein IKG42_04705 [Clostridia bacterium]|nr:hypothetical protein [Clostridia bacterium]
MEKDTKDNNKILGMNRVLFLSIVILLCVLSICFGIYAQFFYKYSKTDPFLFGLGRRQAQNDEEIKRLKNEFNSIFTNDVECNGEYTYNCIDENKDIVYTSKQTTDEKENYSVDINIPKININSDTAKKINEEINSVFKEKLDNVIKNGSQKTIYNINYKAYVNGDLLSLIIKSTLKEGNNNQTVIIKTYNYNLANNEIASFKEVLDAKGIDRGEVQADIDDELKSLNKSDEELKAQTNYDIKLRDLDSDMYDVDNVDNFIVSTNGYLYVIFAYGNQELTSKHDIIIFK